MATIKGNSSANTLNGTSGDDYIYGYDGNDTLYGLGGSDHIYGGNGADKLDGGLGVDWLYGEGGNDTLYFGGYGDHYDGGAGFDTLSFAKKTAGWTLDEIGLSPGHTVEEAGGSIANVEKVLGSSYADNMQLELPPGGILDGGPGDDTLVLFAGPGGDAPNRIYGGSGNDHLDWFGQDVDPSTVVEYGGSGNDTLHGYHVTGGTGADTFLLDAYADDLFATNDGATVTDFHHSEGDKLVFDVDGPSTLTHSGDIWTVHNSEGDFSFEITNVTSLSTSDYHFG